MRAAAAQCLLALGSNLGDRRRNLATAIQRLGRLPDTRVLARSRVFDTVAVGPKQARFLNQALLCRTTLSPMGLLVELKRLEVAAGRRPGRRWGPRPLDLDILDFGGLRMRGPWLRLPHREAAKRAFVLAPVCDIRPAWKPDGRRSAKTLLAGLSRVDELVRPLP
jgi:dihydroneopterin aldolase/2-amino-4-hydroxy-6-hydroxymethyldihydropteridine diphosphokinase